MVIKKIINFLLSFILLSSVQAVDIELKVQDLPQITEKKYEATQNETFSISVIIHGADNETSKVKIEGLNEFVISGRSKSTSISIINGKHSMHTEYTFDLVPTKQGEFKIGPAFIKHEGRKIKSDSIVINVKKNQVERRVASSSHSQHPSKPNNGYIDGYEVFCELKTDKEKMVVGEPVILSIRIFARGNILQLSLEPPKFNGFLSKKIGPIKKFQQQVKNKWFDVYEENYLLYPLSPGQKEIKPIHAEFSVPTSRSRSPFLDDSFFSGFFASSTKRKQALSNDLTLQVSSLPKYSGNVDAVGNFTKFYAHVDQNNVKVNEPVVLYLDLDGQGNLEQIAAPKLKFPSNFKFYESKFSVRQDPEQDYKGGSKHFEYILQVGQPGEYTIPEQKFTFFDIYSRDYKTLKTDPITLIINPDPDQKNFIQDVISSIDENGNLDQSEQIKQKFEEDINFIEEDRFSIRKEYVYIPWWLFIILCSLPFLFLNKFIFNLVREKFFYKFSKKYTHKKNLLRIERQLNSILKNNSISDLYDFFLQFFAEKFDTDILLVTEKLISDKLKKKSWKEGKIREFLDYLNECASFNFASKSGKNNYDGLLKKAKYWFLLLNK